MNRTKRVMALALGMAVAASITLAGCSSGDSGGSGTTAKSPALTVGMPNGPQTNNSNPFVGTSSANSLGYKNLIYEPLAQVNLVNPSSKPTPWLATSWTWNASYTEIDFTIRAGVKWSDGKALSNKDVAYTLNLMKGNQALNGNAIPFGTITAEGTDQVKVTFTQPQFTTQSQVLGTSIVPEHIWSKIADPTKDLNQKPVGSGPYVLKTWTAQAVTLTPNPHYWGGKPKVPEVRYTSYNDNNAQTTALVSGATQWSYVFIPNYEKVYTSKASTNNLWFPSGLGIHGLWLNLTKAPFDNVAFRQAMNQVIDRNKISSQGESGLYPLVDSPTGIPQPAGTSFISPKYANQKVAPDVSAAKKTLTAAGYSYRGETLIMPNGKPVPTINLVDPAGWSDYLADLQIIAANLKEIGVTAKVSTMTADAWTTAVAEGNFDATLHWTNTGATPYDIYENIMDGAQYQPIGKSANWNFGRFQSPQATAALKQYATASSDAQRTTALATLQDIMVQQVPMIPLVAGPIGAEFSTKYYTGWPTASDPYAMPQPTQASASQILMHLKPVSK